MTDQSKIPPITIDVTCTLANKRMSAFKVTKTRRITTRNRTINFTLNLRASPGTSVVINFNDTQQVHHKKRNRRDKNAETHKDYFVNEQVQDSGEEESCWITCSEDNDVVEPLHFEAANSFHNIEEKHSSNDFLDAPSTDEDWDNSDVKSDPHVIIEEEICNKNTNGREFQGNKSRDALLEAIKRSVTCHPHQAYTKPSNEEPYESSTNSEETDSEYEVDAWKGTITHEESKVNGNSPQNHISFCYSEDREYNEFWKFFRTEFKESYLKVKEIRENLFNMSNEFSLAHCVAEDMNMEAGIAIYFSHKFKRRDKLYQQRQKQGGLAVLEIGNRHIYYLVTKMLSNGKPTMYTLWCSLNKLRQHVEQQQVKKLAIPRIGCGLDRLRWSEVKPMIEYVFRDTNVEITVCNFQPTKEELSFTTAIKCRKCHVVNEPYPLVDIAEETVIIYLGTEDGYVSGDMQNLDAKFRILMDYKNSRKQLGDLVRSDRAAMNYCVYGFIVRKSRDDPFDFIAFQKGVNSMKKFNRDNDYYYVGIQAFRDTEDEQIMSKIVNLLRFTLINMEVYVCQPNTF